MAEHVSFQSDGHKLSGLIELPPGLKPGERRPAVVLLHGFGGSKDGAQGEWASGALTQWGYVILRFDFRGCGESEGERGRIICLEQVTDASNALTYLASRPEVDPQRIAFCGGSLGAAVAIYTAGSDSRVAAVISQGGWGHGERKFRMQHSTPEAWNAFMKKLVDGVRHRDKTGKSMMVPRFDIVPIPERLRAFLKPDSIMEFPAETPLSMLLFQPDEMIANIAPRPVLLLHAARDSVTPTNESIELFKRAKLPVELHLIDGADHFMFAEANPRVVTLVKDWLDRYFPVHPKS
jgi:dipeptidyl aminopeptidase/acylaminoacyl peptidase